MLSRISVAIITKGRGEQLTSCLGYLSAQSQQITELIIVSNEKSPYLHNKISLLTTSFRLPIHLFERDGLTLPECRDFAIKRSKSKWLAFIDDDCLPTLDWLKNIQYTIDRNPQSAAILAYSGSIEKNNPYSLSYFLLNSFWKKSNVSPKGVVINEEVFDTKNCVVNTNFVKEKNIFFSKKDEVNYSEDIFFASKILKEKGEIFYAKDAVVLHKDPVSFSEYLQKYKKDYSFYKKYKKISHSYGRVNSIDKQKKSGFRKYVLSVLERAQLSFLGRLKTIIITYLTIMMYIISDNLFAYKKEK